MKFDAAALIRIREERGLNRRELAEAAGVDPSTVTRLESGERASPSATIVVKLAHALRCDVRDLVHERPEA